jgi:addiction module RelE/StbE family toxin
MTVFWTESAMADLRAIEVYFDRHSPKYARSLVDRILTRTERLADFPQLGRHVPELEDESLRELIESSYRIVYRVYENQIDVLAVVHGVKQLPSTF